MIRAISFILKNKFQKRYKKIYLLTITLSLIIIVIVGPYLFYNINYIGRIFPNTYIGNVNVGGLRPDQAKTLITKTDESEHSIKVLSETKSYTINSIDIGLKYSPEKSIGRAYNLVRTGNIFYDLYKRTELLFFSQKVGIDIELDNQRLDSILADVNYAESVPPVEPEILITNNTVAVINGNQGKIVNIDELRFQILKNFSIQKFDNISIPITIIDKHLTNSEIYNYKTRAEKILGKVIELKYDQNIYTFTETDLVRFINPFGEFNKDFIGLKIEELNQLINKEPQNPKFEFDGKRVTEFAPAINGIYVDSQKLENLLIKSTNQLVSGNETKTTINIPYKVIQPITTTEKVNSMGIKELIGLGSSTYFHSIPGRVFNVNLAASRINGSLVAPGETFSFNQALGDVSKLTGYKEAYVIQSGKTVLGDGGGVCQVSSTLFRAVLNAGLPVSERSAHAYRVGYYEQNSPPGMDATVYYPSPDFKFINNTENYILIEAKNDPKNYSLVFELYGTSDGRVAKIGRPVVSNYTPPLPTIYQDDPTLPVGTLKQTDFAAAGARISFDYSVSKNGIEIYKKIFVSNYQPWANMFLRGTKI